MSFWKKILKFKEKDHQSKNKDLVNNATNEASDMLEKHENKTTNNEAESQVEDSIDFDDFIFEDHDAFNSNNLSKSEDEIILEDSDLGLNDNKDIIKPENIDSYNWELDKKNKKKKFNFWNKIKHDNKEIKIELDKTEQEFVEKISKIKSIDSLSEIDDNMDYRTKINVWSNNFKVLNQDILSNLEISNKNPKPNTLETFWNKMSFLSQSVYKTIVILMVSLIWFVFWSAIGGFEKYSIWQYSVYILSLVGFLFIVEIAIYINNVKNKGHSNRLINYYLANGVFTLLNYLIRILFLFTPFFVNKFIQIESTDPGVNQLIGKLSVATSAPSLSLFFASIFYVPVHWNQIFRKVIISTGIIHIFSHLYLLKNYKNNPSEIVYQRLRDNWVRLRKVYHKPLGIGYHPEFIRVMSEIKSNLHLSIEDQKQLLNSIKKVIIEDLRK
ncbi:Uncharacterised protein [Mesomycoplasma conjunctivae]|uniref:Uncharacterized protein n=1 Tax=Mesomycoplasma conjunctivae (strain ATCC 25834 / NCTC 10147 / HRC/581) TaxID=572263 RepID=C5J6H4_MESCH|nr:ABC transporter permease [Mesomycoplasma conjunctivae]CAT05066.1 HYPOTHETICAL PROTEIN MCJ_003780 [Mesomycoplasma conjunctivae]VEU66277.1 Uncharacterised protein [Mesomycoplasma conjunctivae]